MQYIKSDYEDFTGYGYRIHAICDICQSPNSQIGYDISNSQINQYFNRNLKLTKCHAN
jgi:hypothetical protein